MPEESEPTTSAITVNTTTGRADTNERSQSWRSRVKRMFRREDSTPLEEESSIGGARYEEIRSVEEQKRQEEDAAVERRIMEIINESKASRAQGGEPDWAVKVKTYLSSHKGKFKEVGKKAGESAMDESIRQAIQSGFEQI